MGGCPPGPVPLPAPALLCLPLSEEQRPRLDSRPGRPPAPRVPLPGPAASGCTLGRAGRPAGLSRPRGRGRSARQGAQECGGPGSRCPSVWPALCVRLSGRPACLHAELSVGLAALSNHCVCLGLPVCLPVCLSVRGLVPDPALPLMHSVAWQHLPPQFTSVSPPSAPRGPGVLPSRAPSQAT